MHKVQCDGSKSNNMTEDQTPSSSNENRNDQIPSPAQLDNLLDIKASDTSERLPSEQESRSASNHQIDYENTDLIKDNTLENTVDQADSGILLVSEVFT